MYALIATTKVGLESKSFLVAGIEVEPNELLAVVRTVKEVIESRGFQVQQEGDVLRVGDHTSITFSPIIPFDNPAVLERLDLIRTIEQRLTPPLLPWEGEGMTTEVLRAATTDPR